jgi:hypothetical protein
LAPGFKNGNLGRGIFSIPKDLHSFPPLPRLGYVVPLLLC